MVGAVKRIVARNFWIASRSESGVAFSKSAVLAPKCSGNASSPPNPKVKASGGVPMKTSSALGFRQERGKQSHMAITSRWKCIVPLGLPVVPEVKAINATSSARVSTFRNSGDCLSRDSSGQYRIDFKVGQDGNADFSS